MSFGCSQGTLSWKNLFGLSHVFVVQVHTLEPDEPARGGCWRLKIADAAEKVWAVGTIMLARFLC